MKIPAFRASIAAKARSAIATRFDILAEGFGLVFAGSGAAIAAVLGKLIIGIVLAALALGFLLRLKGRKRRAEAVTVHDARPTIGTRLVTGFISACEVAALVEATNLPIRFDQPGFQMGHWYLLLLALFAAYFLQLPLVSKLLGKQRSHDAA